LAAPRWGGEKGQPSVHGRWTEERKTISPQQKKEGRGGGRRTAQTEEKLGLLDF